jgi:hypothetical protein
MSDVLPPPQPQQHAFSRAPAALRIFRFAADSAPRVLELAHVSAFLCECAGEFGSADAALPGALRNEYDSGRFFALRSLIMRNSARCRWLAAKLLAARCGAPMPAAALAPDVTRHDVNWGAEGARRNARLQHTHNGSGLRLSDSSAMLAWAQGPVGVTNGKHYFQVCVTEHGNDNRVTVGWVDDKISLLEYENDCVGQLGTLGSGAGTHSSGAAACALGCLYFGTAQLSATTGVWFADAFNRKQCVVGCLLDVDATPARMAIFVDGEPLAAQCQYDFPKDGRAWFPSVALGYGRSAVHSCSM